MGFGHVGSPSSRAAHTHTHAHKHTQVLPDLAAEHREFIYSLFDGYVDAGLEWLKRKGKEFIPAVENNRTASL